MRLVLVVLVAVLQEENARYILPTVPDVVHPPVPDDGNYLAGTRAGRKFGCS
jgi:hypothetical protein